MQITRSSYTNNTYLPVFSQAKTVEPSAGQVNPAADQTRPEVAEAEQREAQALKARDQEVRMHEQAHLSAAGSLAISGASFEYVTGPDGQRYAVGGEVSIDVSEVPGDPQATLLKAETIRRAAMAPAQPSGQDYSVASKAAAMANKASMELLKSLQGEAPKGGRFDMFA